MSRIRAPMSREPMSRVTHMQAFQNKAGTQGLHIATYTVTHCSAHWNIRVGGSK